MVNSAGAADARTDDSVNSASDPRTGYSERLYLTWWGWPLPLIGAALLATEFQMGYPGVRGWLPYLVLLPLTLLILISLGRARVRVADSGADGTELHVGDAHIPLRFVGKVEVVAKDGKRKALGPELDPAAFVLHRGWIGTMVRVHLNDPADPTPYWLFSTRHPEQVTGLLRGAKE